MRRLTWASPADGREPLPPAACGYFLVITWMTPPATPGTWRSGPSKPTARAWAASAVLQGRLVILGGWASYASQIPLATVEAYDPESASWSSLPPMPLPRTDASAAVLGGILYVMGGRTETALLDRVDAYIP
jgi:hypothetical protein